MTLTETKTIYAALVEWLKTQGCPLDRVHLIAAILTTTTSP